MVKKEKTEIEKKEVTFGNRAVTLKTKNDYMRNLINGRYYLARANMMVEQLNEEKIVETIDGCPKSAEMMIQEYVLMKMQAINSLRSANAQKKELLEDHKVSETEIKNIEAGYYTGDVTTEAAKNDFQKGSKAKFVSE